MTWFKIDDQSAFDEKVVAAGNEAWGAFCRVGAWCSAKLTDGKFSYAIAVTVAPKRVWDRLVEVGLVTRLDNGELQMVKFLKWNPPATTVLEQRKAAQDRMQRFRSREQTANGNGTNAIGSTSPIPSRPDPEPNGSVGAPAPRPKRGTALPEDWAPDEQDAAYAKLKGWSAEKISTEAERFKAHHLANGSVMKRWHQAWVTWVLNEPRFRAREQPRSGGFQAAPAQKTMTYQEFKFAPGEIPATRRGGMQPLGASLAPKDAEADRLVGAARKAGAG